MTCGNTMTNIVHLPKVQSFVKEWVFLLRSWTTTKDSSKWYSGIFDFIIGFAGPTVVPRIVGLALLDAMQKIYIYHENIWDGIAKAVTSSSNLILVNTPVVVIFKDDNGVMQTRCLIYSIGHVKVWGLDHRCIRPGCPPGNMRCSVGREPNHAAAAIQCSSCKWKSKYHPRPDWLYPTKIPFVFWHDFPLDPSKHDYIILREGMP